MPDASSRLSTALADRYRLERELGAGGMATVHLAQDLKHDRKVAVKVLRPELAAVIDAERFVVVVINWMSEVDQLSPRCLAERLLRGIFSPTFPTHITRLTETRVAR